jgi:putative addiction module component (TIGR02574 family)
MIPNLELNKLTVTERLQLIGECWDSIDAEEYPNHLSQTQKDELDTRLVTYQQDNKGKSWETVKVKILAIDRT